MAREHVTCRNMLLRHHAMHAHVSQSIGVLFLILSLAGACNLIQQYAPACIKKSITVGLGLFQALIGFECMKLVIRGNDGVLLAIGDVTDPHVLLALAGLIIICICLVLNIKASMLIGMAITTVIAWTTGLAASPVTWIEMPTLAGTWFQLDFAGFWMAAHQTIPITLVLLFVSVFDTAGVQFAAGSQADLIVDGKLPGSTAAFSGAAVATMLGACIGSSPIIIHNETCAGIQVSYCVQRALSFHISCGVMDEMTVEVYAAICHDLHSLMHTGWCPHRSVCTHRLPLFHPHPPVRSHPPCRAPSRHSRPSRDRRHVHDDDGEIYRLGECG